MNYHQSFTAFGHTVTSDSDYWACLLLVLALTVIVTTATSRIQNETYRGLAYLATGVTYLAIALLVGIIKIQIT